MGLSSKPVKLAPRERSILRMWLSGRPPKEIGDLLEIATGTVNTRIQGIVRKARLKKREELVAWAFQHPECLRKGASVEAGLHPPDCRCEAPFCQVMLPMAA
jgi:DNA-binding CsgD family transcriptional regulator